MPDLPFLSTSPRDPPDDLSPDQLAARCQNRQPDGSHEPFCLELFRRAIVESCSLCWHFVHRLYYPLARYWVTRRANLPSDDVDDLTQDAFVAFHRFYTPDRLAQAKGLGQVLRYLESCADTAVKQFWRRKKRSPVEVTLEQEVVNRHHSDASAEAAALERVTTQEIWSAIEARCQSEQERIVAWRSLVVGAKPHEIAAWHPELFPGVKDVYRVKRSLFDRLSRDPLLQAMYEKGFPEHYTR